MRENQAAEKSSHQRRHFLLAAGALLVPRRARSQPLRGRYRVGVICPFGLEHGQAYLAALRERLAVHGLRDGRNLTLDARFPGASVGNSRVFAADNARDLAARKVDAIFVLTTNLTQAVVAAAPAVPIVFAWVADPVRSGIVEDYRRPGGNATGITNRHFELTVKRVELVRECIPAARRVAVLGGTFSEAGDTTSETAMRLAQAAAARLGLKLIPQEVLMGWADGLRTAVGKGAQAAIVTIPFGPQGQLDRQRDVIQQAIAQRIPVVYSDRESVEAGGLMSYATNAIEDMRRGADYLARVLKGESPSTLPVDQAAVFELAVNVEAARRIGLSVPQSVLLRADRVVDS
ncbi:MAG TPA: ABC transporter substrate-binding protein [Burkholderiaceae bacterium]|nr:ABC transporter substrate-binding protein [Burkholderiaceae bacterium]